MDVPKVLIVDDEEANRFILQKCLRNEGYELIEAAHGKQALEMVEEEQPDVVLLDVMMPVLDGMVVLKKLQEQEHTRHIPVIMVSAMGTDAHISASLDAGAIDHLVKPFSGLVVQARVRSALRNRAASDSTSPSDHRGKVIGFIGSKGGVGNTTLAVNVAVSLVTDQPLSTTGTSALAPERKVTLVELRPNLGTVSHQLGILARSNMQELVGEKDPRGINQATVEKCLAKHSSGLNCLLAPHTFDYQRSITGQQTEEILETVARIADYVIVDVPCLPSEATRSAMRCCDFTILTVGLDPAGLAAAQVTLQGLASWGIGGDSLGAVLVARDPLAEAGTYVQQARSGLECRVISVIPWASDVCFAALRAKEPLLLYNPGSHEATLFSKLAHRLMEDHVPELQ